MGEHVTIAKFPSTVEAELARAQLEAKGIEAFVVESAGFNPILNTTLGVAVEVPEADAKSARAILDELAKVPDDDGSEDEEPGEDVVRCPSCELEYCFFERERPAHGTALSPVFAVAAALGRVSVAKRWHCRKCLHVWDDPREGPKQRTKLPEGLPRPVFRLFRGNAGMGIFLGSVLGAFGALFLPGPGAFFFIAGAAAGLLIGRGIGADLCSEASCRTPLPQGAERCPGCKGVVAGRIKGAHEHYSAAADERRALARLASEEPGDEAEELSPRPRRKKKHKARKDGPRADDGT
jgi:hypothetical protein